MKNNRDHQPYDSTLKGLFEAEAAEIIPYLVPNLRLIGPVDITKTNFQEVSQVQDRIDPLLRESPTIMAIVADEVAKAKAEGLREAILDLVSARFSPQVVAQVQQTIAPTQDIEQMKRFFRQLIRVSGQEPHG